MFKFLFGVVVGIIIALQVPKEVKNLEKKTRQFVHAVIAGEA